MPAIIIIHFSMFLLVPKRTTEYRPYRPGWQRCHATKPLLSQPFGRRRPVESRARDSMCVQFLAGTHRLCHICNVAPCCCRRRIAMKYSINLSVACGGCYDGDVVVDVLHTSHGSHVCKRNVCRMVDAAAAATTNTHAHTLTLHIWFAMRARDYNIYNSDGDVVQMEFSRITSEHDVAVWCAYTHTHTWCIMHFAYVIGRNDTFGGTARDSWRSPQRVPAPSANQIVTNIIAYANVLLA